MDFSKHLSSLVDTACDIHEEDFIASEEESKSNSDRNTKLIKYLAEIENYPAPNTSLKIEFFLSSLNPFFENLEK